MNVLGATYAVHGWVALLIILVILGVFVAGAVVVVRAMKRGVRRVFKRNSQS
jgi:heme exporter protein D